MEASAHEPSTAEGYLTKKAGVQWKRYWFVLDDDVITYYSSARGNLIPEGRLALDGKSTVIHLTTPANAFQVVASNATVLKVFADTKEERDRWFTAVNKRINQRMKEGGPPRRRRQNTRSVVSGGSTFELDVRYDIIKPYGGRGVRALDRQSNNQVLISKHRGAFEDLTEAKGIARDICIMRNLDHENILKVVDVLPPPSVEDFDDVYIVSELMETDLHRVIYSRQHLTNEHTQYFLYQILCAVKYIHSASLIHQGLRPSRVMLNAVCAAVACVHHSPLEEPSFSNRGQTCTSSFPSVVIYFLLAATVVLSETCLFLLKKGRPCQKAAQALLRHLQIRFNLWARIEHGPVHALTSPALHVHTR